MCVFTVHLGSRKEKNDHRYPLHTHTLRTLTDITLQMLVVVWVKSNPIFLFHLSFQQRRVYTQQHAAERGTHNENASARYGGFNIPSEPTSVLHGGEPTRMYYVSIKYNYLIYTFVDFVSRFMFRLDSCAEKKMYMLIAPAVDRVDWILTHATPRAHF